MRNRGFLTAFLSLIAVWVQLMAPLATAALESNHAFDPVICSGEPQHVSPDDNRKSPPPAAHHHCLLCLSCFGGLGLPQDQESAAFTLRVASLLRLSIAAPKWFASRDIHEGQPRGPPSLI